MHKETKKKWTPGKILGLVLAGLLLTAGITFLIITLVLRNKPISSAYGLTIDETDYVFHIDDSQDAKFHFTEESDNKYLLKLQERRKQDIQFSSSDEKVLKVDEKGHFTAVGKGEADVIITVSDLQEKIHVTSHVRGESLSFNQDVFELNVGDTVSTRVIVKPDDAVLFDGFTFHGTDDSVMEVDPYGGITALNPGTANIVVEADGLKGEAEVRVYQPMTGIALTGIEDGQVMNIERGNSLEFPISFFPENTTDPRDVTYTLSDPEAGDVDENGVFTAKGRGRVTLTAECNGFTDSVDIDMHVTLSGIEINHEEITFNYLESDQLTYATIPADTTDGVTCSMVSENPNVITVDGNGIVTAVGPGSAAVVVNVNGFEKRCLYHVLVPVTAVNISHTGVTLNIGDSLQLGASVYPEFTTEDHSISWSSDNAGIVSVDQNGVVRAVGAGYARIYATHGGISNSCLFEIKDPNSWQAVAERIINFGKQFLGTRYVLGGDSLTGGIDCSSFTRQCFATQGIYLPRLSYQQAGVGAALPVDAAQWRPGDLIFYAPHGGIGHVAIYIGNGQVLHAAESMGGVCITGYIYNGYTPCAARRYF